MDDLRVLIVADDPLVRAGLATMVAGQAGLAAGGRAAGDADLAAEAAAGRATVVVWDLGWDPAPASLARLRTAMERLARGTAGSLPVVVLLPDEAEAAEAWAVGARGLLLRDAGSGQVAAALAAVARGLVVVDPALAAAVLPGRGQDAVELVEPLTQRELEVLQLVADGLPNKAIAARLGISEHTVKFHINAILSKLGVQGRTEAVVRATRLGLIIL